MRRCQQPKKHAPWYLVLPIVLLLANSCGHPQDPARSRAASADIEAQANAYPLERAKAQRMRLPLSLRDLNMSPPRNGNAAPLYQKLGHMLRAYPLNSRELALEGLSTPPMPTPRALGYARQALAHRAKYLQMIHQAASMPVCSFSHDWGVKDPEEITFPEIATAREASLLLTGQSVLMAVDGQTLAAVQNESLGFRLADQIAGDQILAAHGYACDIDTTTFNAMQKILYMSHGDPKVAQAVQSAIAARWHSRGLARSLTREVAFEQGLVSYVRAEGPQPFYDTIAPSVEEYGLEGEKAGSLEWNKLMDANGAVLLQETSGAIEAADKPFPVAKAAMKAIVADSMRPLPSRILPALLVPNFPEYVTRRAQDQARAEITSAGAAVLAWESAHGKLPDTLSIVMPTVPEDPFNGKPLRYKKEGTGFVIYSVGPFGTFDGGSAQSEPPVTESLFRYPLPSYDYPAKPAPAVAGA